MSKEYSIKINGLEKNFSLNQNKSLKGLFINREKAKKYKALDNINLNIEAGQFISIIGGNGSGKSTLLKIISGIYHPTKGNIVVSGKIISFIELGVGFNENLSARDNIFLNGAILGIDKKKLSKEFDHIIDFAEVRPFINQKLKTFSTGMKVRLAFSVAIRADADIYLIDEVLSVGDESFAKKCLLEFEKLIKAKKTIVLVSHSMELVRRMSDVVMIMEKGKIIDLGNAIDMIKKYQKRQNQIFTKNTISSVPESQLIKALSMDVIGQNNNHSQCFDIDENINIIVNLNIAHKLESAILIFSIFDEQGKAIFAKSYIDNDIPLKSRITLSFKSMMGSGTYFINFGIFHNKEIVFQMDKVNYFCVENTKGTQGIIAGLNSKISLEAK